MKCEMKIVALITYLYSRQHPIYEPPLDSTIVTSPYRNVAVPLICEQSELSSGSKKGVIKDQNNEMKLYMSKTKDVGSDTN